MLPRYPSTNQYDIPTLIKQDGAGLHLPLVPWGATKRTALQDGTWHFYVDDWRFKRLWDDPDAPLRTGAKAIVEPNYSITEDTPFAEAVWRTYQKRTLARYWQSQGFEVWVDLYVGCSIGLMMMGVPGGYSRFATVGVTTEDLDTKWDLVKAWNAEPHLLVYGGSQDVREWCQIKGAIHVPRHFAGRKELTRSIQPVSGHR